MPDAVERYCSAVEAGDMAAMAEVLSPHVELPSPVIGRAVFRGRDDIVALLSQVYGVLRDVRWEPPVGAGRQRLAVAEASVVGMRIGDAMVFELDEDGRIERIRPHLRPLLATVVFFLLLGPAIARQPALLARALRA